MNNILTRRELTEVMTEFRKEPTLSVQTVRRSDGSRVQVTRTGKQNRVVRTPRLWKNIQREQEV